MSSLLHCGLITHDLTHGQPSGDKPDPNYGPWEGPFHNETPASWKNLCKYYSGDSDCKPNTAITKRLTKYSDIQVLNAKAENISDLPSIDKTKPVTIENWKTTLALCEEIKTPPANCAGIHYDDYMDDYKTYVDVVNDADVTYFRNNTAKNARCTEIGYYFDLKCKKGQNEEKCVDASCDDLEMYESPNQSESSEFCRNLDQCMTNTEVDKCEDFNVDVDAVATFEFSKLGNTGMSLTQIAEKCNEIGYNMDFDKYSYDSNNFEGGAGDVCVKDIKLTSGDGKEQEKCIIIGALQGEFMKYESSGDNCILDDANSCKDVKFKLPVSYGAQYLKEGGKLNVNPVYYHDRFPSFGEYLCNKLGCSDGDYDDADEFYTCETVPDDSSTGRLMAVGFIGALVTLM